MLTVSEDRQLEEDPLHVRVSDSHRLLRSPLGGSILNLDRKGHKENGKSAVQALQTKYWSVILGVGAWFMKPKAYRSQWFSFKKRIKIFLTFFKSYQHS